MEYQYYLRQIYRKDGSVWIDILEAAQAEKLGYQDGDKYTQNDGVVYINGFDSPSALNTFIEDLHGCVNRSTCVSPPTAVSAQTLRISCIPTQPRSATTPR